MDIKLLSAHEILPLRQKVLRPGQPQSLCRYPEDENSETLHVGAVDQKQIIGVATFLLQGHADFLAKNPYRLRGMATDSAFQSRGCGKAVLLYGMDLIRQRGGDFLWCNARESAFGFYQKLGLEFHGALFDITGIGPHKVMYKYLLVR